VIEVKIFREKEINLIIHKKNLKSSKILNAESESFIKSIKIHIKVKR